MRVGIVGCGGVALVHIKSILKTGKCEIASVCDLNGERAAELAKEHNIPGVYTDFSAMLQKEKLDIVHVLTPPQSHAKLAIDAMDAGCHVMVEKPMCMTVKEADQMIEASKRNKVKFGVIHSYLYTPAIQQALNAVKNGELGDLIRVDTLVSLYPLLGWNDGKTDNYPGWYYTLQGALFGEIIPHGLYVQLAFLGKIKNAFGLTRATEEKTDLLPFSDLQILMDCENATGGLFVSSRIKTPYALILTRIIGTEGIMVANIPTATVTKTKLSRTESFPIIETNRLFSRAMMNIGPSFQMLSKTISLGGKALFGSVGLEMTHETLVKGFVDAIENNKEPLVTAEDGREVIKTTNMLWENILT